MWGGGGGGSAILVRDGLSILLLSEWLMVFSSGCGCYQAFYLLGLSERARELLLSLFNCMFSVSRFPPSWRDTLVAFVPKAGSNKFRPISLTSNLCKTVERRVQKRLKILAENSSWIPAN